jgi:hypothetical protein
LKRGTGRSTIVTKASLRVYQMANYVVVRAFGRQLDNLRGEASRISRGREVDWSVEAADQGVRFCFGDLESKASFVSFCRNLGLPFADA